MEYAGHIRRDYKRIAEYLAANDAECGGMPYARYQEMEWERELNRGRLGTFISMVIKKWHFFAGMPVSKSLPGTGELKSRELTATPVSVVGSWIFCQIKLTQLFSTRTL